MTFTIRAAIANIFAALGWVGIAISKFFILAAIFIRGVAH
jgi:hypothetical protein